MNNLIENYFMSTRHLVMAQDLNGAGKLFGGRLLAWIDEAAALYASCQMNTHFVVTLKFSETIFKVPVSLNDIVIIYCKVNKKGSTSITIDVRVIKKNNIEETIIIDNQLVFVSVDENNKPIIWNKIK